MTTSRHHSTVLMAVAAALLTGMVASAGSAAAKPYVETAPTVPGGGVDPRYVDPTPPVDPREPPQQTRLEKREPAGDFGAQAQQRYVFANPRGPTSLLRNTVAGFVLGSALNGWTFDVVDKCTPSGCGTWYRGTIYGNYQNCGFALAQNIDPSSGAPISNCPTNWQAAPASFGSAFNCSGCSGPRAVILTRGGVNRWLNAKALSGGGAPTDYYGSLPQGTCVEWRYVTLNQQWVLAKWRGASDDNGSWAFMERASFPPNLPTGQERCAP